MDLIATPEAGLLGLFITSFLAATLLPGGSEVVLLALLMIHPEQTVPALALATLGNTLGGMSTYGMARLLPEKSRTGRMAKYAETMRRHGSPVLLLAWAPVIGDVLCAAAGWLRLAWLPCLLWMATGKGARYALIAWVATTR